MKVVPGVRGNRYTEEDQKFFIEFISYELNRNPELTKSEIIDMLHSKVTSALFSSSLIINWIFIKCPHHSASSWSQWWARHHDLPDKIYAAAHGEDVDRSKDSDGSDADDGSDASYDARGSDFDFRPKSGDGETSEPASDESCEDHGSDYMDDNASRSDDDSSRRRRSSSEKGMGQSGEPFTKADLRAVAKHLAYLSEEDGLTKTEIWKSFGRKVSVVAMHYYLNAFELFEQYTQRAWKSWAEFHRRNERSRWHWILYWIFINDLTEIDRLAEKYKERLNERTQSKGFHSRGSSKRKVQTDEEDSVISY
jgi:hypothetical protein